MDSHPTLIYCASGNKRLADIALDYGFKYGAQLPATIYHAPYFVDQNWKKPERDKYMAALAEHRPALATVLDWEREEQLPEVLSWAEEAAQYVSEAVIIIPKVMGGIDQLPRTIGGKPVRLGYSVPTRFAGTCLPLWEFTGYEIHLLGGSPKAQMTAARYMNVQSADGNYVQKQAVQRNQFYVPTRVSWSTNGHFPRLSDCFMGGIDHDAPYHAFRLSCINVSNAWRGLRHAIAYGVPRDIDDINVIARQYRQELGFVRKASLLEAMTRYEVYVAFSGAHLIGFVNWHKRKDGWRTVYEIAVHRDWRGCGVGQALMRAVGVPVRLKCTTDNSANRFYEGIGMVHTLTEPGRKRPLNVWEIAS